MEYHNQLNQTIPHRDKQGGAEKPTTKRSVWRNLTREELLIGASRTVTAFLVGVCSLPFSSYPLGMAFLCALDSRVGFAVFGLILSSFFVSPLPWWLYCGTIIATLATRIMTRLFVDIPVRLHDAGGIRGLIEHIHGRFFCESLYLRMTCSCISVFILSLYAIIAGGFRYYDLFGAFFSMLVAPIATYLYTTLFSELSAEKKWMYVLRKIAKIFLAFTLCLSVRGISFATISLSAVVAFVGTMFLCRQEGLVTGTIIGIVCGLSVGVTTIPVYIVVSITAYCLFEISPLLAATVACVAGAVTGMLMNGGIGFSENILSLLTGASVYCAIDKMLSQGGIANLFGKREECDYCEKMCLERKYTKTREELDELCHSLMILSETFSRISLQLRKPSAEDIKATCNEVFENFCHGCYGRSLCWESRHAVINETMERLTIIFDKGEIPEKKDLPVEFCSTCKKAETLIELANEQVSLLIRNALNREKAGVLAADYGAISSIVRELTERVEAEYCENKKKSAEVRENLCELGFDVSHVSVCGESNFHVFVSGLSPIPEKRRLDYLQKQIGRTLNCQLNLPLISIVGNACTLYSKQIVTYNTICGTIQAAKEGVCGDSARVFEDKTGRFFYAVINDGMGSGKEASETAEISTTFLEKLLFVGVNPESAIKMLNQFLCFGQNGGNSENSTTVDLLRFDKMTGRAIFLKSGAAPTYVKRGSNIFKLTSATLPVGILDLTDAKRIEFDAHNEDIIILSSDGVSQGEDECLWLLDYLNNTKETNPQMMADYIKEAAFAHGSRDDISALVIKIRQNL